LIEIQCQLSQSLVAGLAIQPKPYMALCAWSGQKRQRHGTWYSAA